MHLDMGLSSVDNHAKKTTLTSMLVGRSPQPRDSVEPQSSGSRRDVLALLSIGLVLLASLGNLTHEAWIPHHWCALHADFVDAAPPDAAQSATNLPHVLPRGTAEARAAGTAASEHAHCPLIAAHVRGFGVPGATPRVVIIARRPVATDAVVQPACPFAATSYLLLRAPKTSPPPGVHSV